MEIGDVKSPERADLEAAARRSCFADGAAVKGRLEAATLAPPPPPLPASPSRPAAAPAAAGRLLASRSLFKSSISSNATKNKNKPPQPREQREKEKEPENGISGRTLSRRLNSVEAFFAWGAEVKGAFAIGLCVQLKEEGVNRMGKRRRRIDPELLRVAAAEASLLDQPLARAVVCNPASFDPLRLPRLVLPAGSPAPEFVVLKREDEGHWEREMERVCNVPFRAEEVVLLGGKKMPRAQRACSLVLLHGGRQEEEEEEENTHHELVVRLNHALFDGKAAVAFVAAVLRRYEVKVAAREAAEEIAAAVEAAAALAAAADSSDDDSSKGVEGGGTLTPDRPASPRPFSPALSSSPVTPLARWPPSALSTPDGGGSRSLSPNPPRSASLPSPPPTLSSPFTALPPSSSALSLRLGPRALLTRIVANVMLMHEGLALARKGPGLRLAAAAAAEEEEAAAAVEEEQKEGKRNGEEIPPPSSSSSSSEDGERCAVSTFALSVEDTANFLRACRREGSSANSALAAAALASAAAVGEISERSGGLSLQTHFDLRGPLRAAAGSSNSSAPAFATPPVGLCSFSEIKWFPRESFEAREGDDGGAASTRKLWSFAKSYGRSIRAAAKAPAGAGLLKRVCGPWRMAPPLTFRLQVVPHILKETAAAERRGESFSSVDVGLSNLGRIDLLSPDAARTSVPSDASRAASCSASVASSLFALDGGEEERKASRSPLTSSMGGSSPPATTSPSLATRGLFFVAGGQRLGPTLAVNAATAAGRLCLVAMTRNGGRGGSPCSSSSSSDASRERVMAELVRRLKSMAASAALAAEA